MKFQNGEPFNAQAVKFSFDRAGAEKSTNKDKRTFATMDAIQAVDEHTVVIVNKELDPDFLFLHGPGHGRSSWSPRAPTPTRPSPWAPGPTSSTAGPRDPPSP